MIIHPKTSGQGNKVDPAAPTYPWRDMRDQLTVRATGVAAPNYSQVGATSFYDYEFVGTGTQRKEGRSRFHIDHDYAPGTDLHFHVHWYPADANAGNVKWYASLAYAKGHNQGAFNFGSPILTNVVQAAPAVQYQHMIAEMVISQTGAGALFNNANFEPDGIIEVMFYRDPADAADTYGSSVYVPYADCHYQSTEIGTKNKSPSPTFYS